MYTHCTGESVKCLKSGRLTAISRCSVQSLLHALHAGEIRDVSDV